MNTVATVLRMSKQELVDVGETDEVMQMGGEVVDDDFFVPPISVELGLPANSVEMFVLSPDGSVAATGANPALNEAWTPLVEAMSERVLAWMAANEVELAGDAYVTASILPATEVSGNPHLDDDQFVPADGVGIVAIVADRDGPRICTESVDMGPVRVPLPLTVHEETATAFAAGELDQQRHGPHSLVIMPGFGQLHSGPGVCGADTDCRHLLVLRGPTRPATA